MSQKSTPSGYYKKVDRRTGEMKTHPTFGSKGDSNNYPEEMTYGEGGNSQIQVVKHKPKKEGFHILSAAREGLHSVAEKSAEANQRRAESNTPEAKLAKQEAEIKLMEGEQLMEEQRVALEIRRRELIEEKRMAEQESEERKIEEGQQA